MTFGSALAVGAAIASPDPALPRDDFPPDDLTIDDFERTIGWTLTDPYALGLTSGYPVHWANPPASETGIGGEGAGYSVSGGIGYVRLPLPQSVSSSATAITLNDGSGCSISPWPSLAGDGIPAVLFADGLTYHLDVKVDRLTLAYAEINHLAKDATSEGGYSIGLFGSSGLWMDSYDASGSTVAFTWAVDTWYRVKVLVSGGTAYVRVWRRDLDPEPGTWTHSKTIAPISGWTPGQFALLLQSYGAVGAPAYTTYGLDNFAREAA